MKKQVSKLRVDTGKIKSQRVKVIREAFKLKKLMKIKSKNSVEEEEKEFLKKLALLETPKLEEEAEEEE